MQNFLILPLKKIEILIIVLVSGFKHCGFLNWHKLYRFGLQKLLYSLFNSIAVVNVFLLDVD